MRRRSFGADPTINQVFDQQILTFKAVLVDLYKKKTNMVAEREALRFRYTTQVKMQIQTLFGSIQSMAAASGQDVLDLWGLLVKKLAQQIPMVEYSGQDTAGFGGNLWALSCAVRVGILSPISYFLDQAGYSSQPNGKKCYQVIANTVLGDGFSERELRRQYFFGQDVSVDVLGGAGAATYGLDKLWHKFTVPMDPEWAKGVIKMYSGGFSSVDGKQYLMSGFDAINSILAAQDFMGIVNQARDMMVKILNLTRGIIQTQISIDENEAALTQFVNDYSQYMASPASADEILRQMREQALADLNQVPTQPPVGSTVVDQVPVDAIQGSVDENPLQVSEDDLTDEETVQPAAQQKSKLPLIAAGIGAAILFFKDK